MRLVFNVKHLQKKKSMRLLICKCPWQVNLMMYLQVCHIDITNLFLSLVYILDMDLKMEILSCKYGEITFWILETISDAILVLIVQKHIIRAQDQSGVVLLIQMLFSDQCHSQYLWIDSRILFNHSVTGIIINQRSQKLLLTMDLWAVTLKSSLKVWTLCLSIGNLILTTKMIHSVIGRAR